MLFADSFIFHPGMKKREKTNCLQDASVTIFPPCSHQAHLCDGNYHTSYKHTLTYMCVRVRVILVPIVPNTRLELSLSDGYNNVLL